MAPTRSSARSIQPVYSIEKKESIRWLENLRQSTALLNALQSLRPHRRPGKRHLLAFLYSAKQQDTIFCCEPVWIVWPGMENIPSPKRCRRYVSQGLHRIQARNKKGEVSEATLAIRYRHIRGASADRKSKSNIRNCSSPFFTRRS